MWWRLVLVAALAVTAWYVVHLIRDNAQLTKATASLTEAVTTLSDRADRIDAALAENEAADNATRAQANRGVGKIQTARRTDDDVIAIDRPWPAAVRGRVFDDPDPTSGSTQAAGAAGARGGGKPVQEPR